jgi:hypothetical protein
MPVIVRIAISLSVLGLAVTIASLKIGSHPAPARLKVQADLKALMRAITEFRADHKQLPRSLKELLSQDTVGGPYILGGERALIDPWGREYLYRLEGQDQVTVGSLGADGRIGGRDANEDQFLSSGGP